MQEQLTWDDFSRLYTAVDINSETIIVELSCRCHACGPCAFKFWLLINHLDALPEFHRALAEVQASDGEEGAISDELTFIGSLSEFLSKPEHQAELLEAYNLYCQDKLPTDYLFTLGDTALIAAALNAHNSLQF